MDGSTDKNLPYFVVKNLSTLVHDRPTLTHVQHGSPTVFTVHDTDRPIVSDSRTDIVLRTVCEYNAIFVAYVIYANFTHRPKELFTTICASRYKYRTVIV